MSADLEEGLPEGAVGPGRGRGSSVSLRTREKAVRWCCGGEVMA